MSQPLLVPLDGSKLAEAVLPWAVQVARARGLRIVLVQAARPPAATTAGTAGVLSGYLTPEMHNQLVAAEIDRSTRYLRDARQRLLPGEVDVELAARMGEPADAILDLADELGAEMIAMASHGRGGLARVLLGSVAERIIHHATVPVLLVRAQPDRPTRPPALGSVVVPLDGSLLAERALDVAAGLVSPGTTLTLVRAELPVQQAVLHAEGVALFEDDEATERALADAQAYVQRIADERGPSGATVIATARVGDPAETIMAVAREQHADLIVMSTHGHTGRARLFLGSVADRVVRRAEAPVLLVSARALAERVVGQGLVRDVMTRDLTTVRVDEPLIVAIRKLLRRRVSGAPVVDEAGALIGVLSEADLLEWQAKLAARLADEEALDPAEYARRLGSARTSSVMKRPATTIQDSAHLSEAIEVFRDRGMRRLPVVDADGKLIGIVTRADVLQAMLSQWEAAGGREE